MSERFDELRHAISQGDEQIVELVNERLRLVAELWELKQAQGLDEIDAGREAALRDALARANGGPLSAEGLDRLVTALLAVTKDEVRRLREARP